MKRAGLNIIINSRLRFLGGALITIVMLFFASSQLRAQVISNNGAAISITSGTVVVSQDLINSSAKFNNFGTLNLSGNFTNSLSSITSGNGLFRIGGNWSSPGSFSHGTSTVILNGSGAQQISTSSSFYNLYLENGGSPLGFYITLGSNVQVMGTLSMYSGNVLTSGNILKLANPSPLSLNYTSGMVLGQFERGIGETGRFLFPLGNVSRPSYYNPATLVINAISNPPGYILSEFITSPPPGNAGLPLADNSVIPGVEVDSAFTTGYWSMTAQGGFSISDYNIELEAAGFTNATDTVRENTRVIKRITGNDWTLDGVHADASGDLVKRNTLTEDISTSGTQYALGQTNPLITGHPRDTTVCENTTVSFSVTATGAETLTYIWYKDGVIIPSGDPHYTGIRAATLTINEVTLADAGNYYCVVRDRFMSTTTSRPAKLTVNKIPVAFLNLYEQNHECSEIPFDNIALYLSHYDAGTRFVWSRTVNAGIETAIAETGVAYNIGDVISGAFKNNTNAPITITFQITPVGPAPTECMGQSVYSSITVNPKPQIIPLVSQICYGANAEITLISDTEFTMPKEDVLRFGYRTYRTSTLVSGFMGSDSDVMYGTVLRNQYRNEDDTLQSIFYNIVPTFTSALGCLSGDTVAFETKIHALPLQDLIITKSLTCEGGSDANLLATTSVGAGGTNGYYFNWFRTSSDREEGYDLNELTNRRGGVWTVTVRDSLGCSNTINKLVSGTTLAPYIYPVAHPLCKGSADGQIMVMETSSMGTPPFEYWIVKEGQDTASTFMHGYLLSTNTPAYWSGLEAGLYTLYIRDDNGCYNTTVEQVELTEPDKVTVTFESKKYAGGFDVSCRGYSDGEVWIKTISGGSGGYAYKWTTVDGVITGTDTSDRLENIPAGKYYIRITDIKGCVAIDSVIITEPLGMSLASSQLSVKNDGVHNVSCYGGSDGYINIEIIGGSGVYTYDWSGPGGFSSSQKNIAQLKTGVYFCIVTDLNGCTLTTPSFTLSEPPDMNISTVLSVSANGGYNISCNGGTGSVHTTATGGVGAYQYIWSTTNGSGIVTGQKDQTSLTAGNYVLTVRDLNDCEKTVNITLTQPDAIILQPVVKHITCASAVFDDGAVSLTVSGGVTPYLYSWSNGDTTKDISGLTEGTYSVTVTDQNGCVATASVIVINPPLLTYTSGISDYNGFNVSCFGLSNGYINIDVTGGTAPFMFNWTGPDGFVASTQSISGLKAGTYTLQIIDSLSCSAIEVFNLSEPDRLGIVLNLSSSLDGRYNLSCAGDKTGYIDIETLNGVGRVEYLWSDGLFGKTRNNLPAGSYNIIITDANGCYSNTSVTLTEPEPVRINFEVVKPFCSDMNNGSIMAEAIGGVVNYNYRWANNSMSRSLTNINAGWHSVMVEDLNGCVAHDSVKVEPQNRSCLLIPNAISPNDDLINDVWNIGNIYLYPEAEVRIFNRWGNAVWVSEKGYPKPWDGTREGRALPIDSYHYIIDLNNGDRPVMGTVTIVR